jgi:23S rRNA pseudouridine2457 synthase
VQFVTFLIAGEVYPYPCPLIRHQNQKITTGVNFIIIRAPFLRFQPVQKTSMPRLILFNKPYLVLCQFRDKDGRPVLADYLSCPGVYPAGRLDHDSEGLLLLTDDGGLQARIADPRWKLPKTYWVQVEGKVEDQALQILRTGVALKDGRTLPAEARRIEPPLLWERDPPIRFRAAIPTTWLEVIIREGRNRQVRRMTAAVGHPTLRLVRVAIGPWRVHGLAPGEWREEAIPEEMSVQGASEGTTLALAEGRARPVTRGSGTHAPRRGFTRR